MSARLSSADVSFFHLEGRTTPQHVGELAVFRPPADGFDYDRLVRLLEERISLVPRYRQKVRGIPGHIANPVWVDDPNFDITYHVRRSALPRPGSDAQLLEFAARILSRLLDRSRPLWEMYLLEGLADDRLAVISKTHHAMVDGIGAVDITQVMLDAGPEPRRAFEPLWMPEPEPSPASLVVHAMAGMARRPATLLDAVRLGVHDVRTTTGRLTAVLGGAVATAAAVVRPVPASPLHATVGEQRRIAIARTRLEDYRQVRRAHGGTVNDVALATVAGALRGWLLQRGEVVATAQTVRALVPVSVHGPGEQHGTGEHGAGEHGAGEHGTGEHGAGEHGASRVAPLLVDLPVGEPDPVRRLLQIRSAMAAHHQSGRSVGADALVALSGFAPPTLHALGARAANGLTQRLSSLVVTNVPGPQQPVYAAGARMTEVFPIPPLGAGHTVSIGLTSYDGGVYFGINGDRDAMYDIGVLAGLVEEALADLVEASTPAAEEVPVPITAARSGRRRSVASRRAPARGRREPKA